MVVVEHVHVLCVHVDVDGGRRHLVCACISNLTNFLKCLRSLILSEVSKIR